MKDKDQPATEAGPAALPLIWDMFGDRSIAQRLLLLSKMIERETAPRLQADFGLSVAQWRVLGFVCISGPATASFIGEAAEVDQAEISRAVKALMQAKLVMREFEPGSRKTMIIVPTPDGTALFDRVRERRRAYYRAITGGLTPEQYTDLNSLLRIVAQEVVNERACHGTGAKPSPRSRG